MSKAATIDLEALLAPVSDEAPAGADPRSNTSPASPYYRVKDARAAARAEERANFDPDGPPAEGWSTVLNAGLSLLEGEAKDLEIAAWVTEALVRLEGFAGLRDGLTLITRLTEAFWEGIYPLPDEDGMETRVAPVTGLNGSGAAGTLAQSIRVIPLIGMTRPFSIWSYDQTLEADKLTDPVRKQARIAAGTASMDTFKESLAETPADDVLETLTTVDECLAALAALSATFDAVAGYDAPPTGALRDLLEHIASSIRFFGAEKLAAAQEKLAKKAAAEAPAPAAQDAAPAAQPGGLPSDIVSNAAPAMTYVPGSFPTRDHALSVLLDIAAYFRRTEPQAPISYTLEEAVRRAKMPLPDLLRELALDSSNISRFLLAAGIKLDGNGQIDIPLPAPVALSTPAAPAFTASSSPTPPSVQENVRPDDDW